MYRKILVLVRGNAGEQPAVQRAAVCASRTTQLVLLDGRSVYLDFFGFVMWDLLPIQASEIERIEVVRGPGSAVWGANAMAGVVNVIGRRPKDMVGTTVLVGTLATGCGRVRPYQRQRLAGPAMRFDLNPAAEAQRDSVLEITEGATFPSAGPGAAGAGCGCN